MSGQDRSALFAAVDQLPADHPFKAVAESMLRWVEDLEDALARSPLAEADR